MAANPCRQRKTDCLQGLLSSVGVVLFCILIYSTSAFAKEVTVKTSYKEKWSPEQVELVNKAAELVMERMPSTQVSKCARRNSWRGIPNEEEWGRHMGIIRRQDKIEINIAKETYDSSVLGMAHVGSASVNKRGDKWQGLDLSVNKKRLPEGRLALEKSVDFWAKVIAHELGHTMGLRHGSGGDWESNYAGYFITEMGFCVMTDGKHGSDHGDLDKRRERKKRFNLK